MMLSTPAIISRIATKTTRPAPFIPLPPSRPPASAACWFSLAWSWPECDASGPAGHHPIRMTACVNGRHRVSAGGAPRLSPQGRMRRASAARRASLGQVNRQATQERIRAQGGRAVSHRALGVPAAAITSVLLLAPDALARAGGGSSGFSGFGRGGGGGGFGGFGHGHFFFIPVGGGGGLLM